MDRRVEQLLSDFPQIFDRRDWALAEDEWVIIDVASDGPELSGRPTSPGDDDLHEDRTFEIDDEATDREAQREQIARIAFAIGADYPGAPCADPLPVPPPDALGFYAPFHHFPGNWGIYLRWDGVAELAGILRQFVHEAGAQLGARDAFEIAKRFIFHHEQYHCAVESFAVRCELPMHESVYLAGLRKLYADREGVTPHEESLATAYAIRKCRSELPTDAAYNRHVVILAIEKWVGLLPPTYSGALKILGASFVEAQSDFIDSAIYWSQVTEHHTDNSHGPAAWGIATHLLSPLLQRNRKFSWLVPRDRFEKSSLSIRYFKPSRVVSCMKHLLGCEEGSGGRHKKLTRWVSEDGRRTKRTTQVSSAEVPEGTLNKMLRDLGAGLSVHQFREQCRACGYAVN